MTQKFKFKRYPSIVNSYQDKAINQIEISGLTGDVVLWSVSEKIHGANLGAYSDGVDTQFASRSQFVNDSFYGLFNGLDNDITLNINAIASDIMGNNPDVEYIIIYGELFGGAYPHDDVERLNNVSKIQDRVFYQPDVGFSAFDIYCVAGNNSYFLGVADFYELCVKYDLFHSVELFNGSFNEVMEYSNEFESTLPDRVGLPDLESNVCEGVVMKPYNCAEYSSGERIILKSKNLKFTEKTNRKSILTIVELTPEQKNAIEIAETYINQNRLDAVLSKQGGKITQQLIGKFIGMLSQDAIEEMNNDSDALTALVKSDRRVITKHIQALSKKIVLANVEFVV